MLNTLHVPALPDFWWPRSFNTWPLPTLGEPEVGNSTLLMEGIPLEGGMPFYHESILLDKVLEYLAPAEGKIFADGTLGGGGHTEALLEKGCLLYTSPSPRDR